MKCCDRLTERIAREVRIGHSVEVVCQAVGVSPGQFQSWRRRGLKALNAAESAVETRDEFLEAEAVKRRKADQEYRRNRNAPIRRLVSDIDSPENREGLGCEVVEVVESFDASGFSEGHRSAQSLGGDPAAECPEYSDEDLIDGGFPAGWVGQDGNYRWDLGADPGRWEFLKARQLAKLRSQGDSEQETEIRDSLELRMAWGGLDREVMELAGPYGRFAAVAVNRARGQAEVNLGNNVLAGDSREVFGRAKASLEVLSRNPVFSGRWAQRVEHKVQTEQTVFLGFVEQWLVRDQKLLTASQFLDMLQEYKETVVVAPEQRLESYV